MTMDKLKPKQSAYIKSVGGKGALRHHRNALVLYESNYISTMFTLIKFHLSFLLAFMFQFRFLICTI